LQHRDGPLPLHHRSPEPWLPQLQRAGDAQSFPELRKLLSGRDMPPVDDALERVLADYARLHADIVSGRRPWRVWIVDCAGFRQCGGLGDRVKGVRACVRASRVTTLYCDACSLLLRCTVGAPQLRLLFYLSVASQRALQILDWPAPSLLDMFEVSVVVAQELRDEDPDPHSWSACRLETWTGACPPTNH
jgi:hypothetical protein